jgi:hypothetical protein
VAFQLGVTIRLRMGHMPNEVPEVTAGPAGAVAGSWNQRPSPGYFGKSPGQPGYYLGVCQNADVIASTWQYLPGSQLLIEVGKDTAWRMAFHVEFGR